MRATRLNLTTRPQKFFEQDKERGIFMFRNTHATVTAKVQFGSPSDNSDGFDILAGDTLSLDRGDLSQAIYLWADAANSDNQSLVG